MTSVKHALNKAGLRLTMPRVKIMELLAQALPNNRHLSAEQIYQRLISQGDKIGLSSVYRVLNNLEECELITRHNFIHGQARYELCRGHHHHMVCMSSGEIIEFTDHDLECQQKQLAKRLGYELLDCKLVLYVQEKS